MKARKEERKSEAEKMYIIDSLGLFSFFSLTPSLHWDVRPTISSETVEVTQRLLVI